MSERVGKYDHQKIEKKWQKIWEDAKAFCAEENSSKKKFYPLVEFPYPSGEGLHTGHVRSYTAMDVVARKRRAEGQEVLYPIGWDAFGLPTENYAIKTGIAPAEVTKRNTDTFRRQLKSLGLSFDWSREINTTDPNYYKWTQWIFLRLYNKGLAYKAKTSINWCPKDKIGLANEEVVDGCCERCGTPVEKREKEQWMLAITKYAQRLYDDLDTVDYIERAKVQQRNWIGPSEGAKIGFPLAGSDKKITVFTTRPDTLFGATYLVLAPEHPLVAELAAGADNKKEIEDYVAASRKRTDIDRSAEGKEKTGVELKGIKAINPANEEEIPIYIADYVLGSYGTGAIMAVPAHDERDFEFAQTVIASETGNPAEKYVKRVIEPDPSVISSFGTETLNGEIVDILEEIRQGREIYTGHGVLINSGQFDGFGSEEAKKKITERVGGRWVTTYKLRDWVFSRQRYWGEPIPMIHCEKDGWVPVPDGQLPVLLPEVEKYQPTDTGESPLANINEFVKTTCPACGGPAKRETDVMPNWAGSSWYYLRYCDPHNDQQLAGVEPLRYWTPVDWYNGGMEHTVLHLLYSRFWHKFLYDEGLVPSPEPYTKRTSHGLILAGDGTKMSKSKGNVVNPDELVETTGADSLRLYEMFMGPFDQAIAWNIDGVVGMRRFLERVWALQGKIADVPADAATELLLNQTIKKVDEDIESLKMNTAVSSLMILSNHLGELPQVSTSAYGIFLRLLAPFAPHITHELAERLGLERGAWEQWPQFDPAKARGGVVKVAVQVNGKARATLELAADLPEEAALAAARADAAVAKWLAQGREVKAVYVAGKVINFVLDLQN